jgi:hypothetical protein
MAFKLSPVLNDQQFSDAGILLSGGKIETYLAGSSTPATTYTSPSGAVAQSNPIILNTRGEADNLIYLTTGISYKLVLKDSLNNVLRTFDNIEGVNDASLTIDQWVNSGVTPTFVSATQFTLSGDQTTAFHNKRRIKVLVTAGTAYGTIVTAVFGALTTVTVVMDSTPLDSGLSSVQLGLLSYNNSSIPSIVETSRATVAATATTTPLWASTAQVQDWTGTPTITNLPAAPQPGVWRTVYPAAGTIFTDNANIDVQGDANFTASAGDKVYIEAITTTTFKLYYRKKVGVVGTVTNDNAAAGLVGEYIESSLLVGSAVNLTSDVAANVTSISLTAGDWDVSAIGRVHANNASTSFTQGLASISATSATLDAVNQVNTFSAAAVPGNGVNYAALGVPSTRISLAATTTIYLVCRAKFTVSTAQAYGVISARRVR